MTRRLPRMVTGGVTATALLAIAWGTAGASTAVPDRPEGLSSATRVVDALVHPDRRKRIPLAVGVPPGPASPTSPQIDSWYALLSRGHCDDLLSRTDASNGGSEALFAAAAGICSAAKRRVNDVNWEVVAAAVQAGADVDDCLSQATRSALIGAVARHAAHPKDPASFAKAPSGLACTPVPTQVLLVQDAADATPTLVVLGVRLFEARKVQIGTQWFPATSRNAQEGTECARVDAPAAAGWKSGDAITLRIAGRGYTTAVLAGRVGPLVSADVGDPSIPGNTLGATSDLDTQACVYTPPQATTP